jgi:hypothetical protein
LLRLPLWESSARVYLGRVHVEPDRVELQERLAAARAEVEANLERLTQSCSRMAATRIEVAEARSERELLHRSAFARLQARLDSMPVIEQAKGVLMAQAACQPDEAFDILRRASQRSNVKVRDLASEIVRRAAGGRHQPTREGGPRSSTPSEDHGSSTTAPERGSYTGT